MDELLWTTRGVVEAPVEEVAEVIFEDRDRRQLTQEGQWWYRGVTTVEPHEKGALVTHEVFNIARTARWGVRLVLLQYRLNGMLPKLKTGNLPERLAELGERLGCRAYLIGS